MKELPRRHLSKVSEGSYFLLRLFYFYPLSSGNINKLLKN